ncbi:hypothetical protein [Planococcus sp. NCCP-2050]|uniref:hypothetical protein n=1 Tax=Planococcus sp. NCCP-2050 TaxID=2944679 RepID=UPI00203D417E|nr:hypothetical protein [Planococcus sp. NCCP-2050]GKW44565.1 hypothetical protein NCCP2050_02570 [Planococcus sp. NCCP-2050]
MKKKQPISKGGIFAGYDIAGYELGGRFLSFLGNRLLKDYLALDPTLSINTGTASGRSSCPLHE